MLSVFCCQFSQATRENRKPITDMTYRNITLLLLALLVWSACQPKADKVTDLQEEMINILNIQGIPQAQYELEPFGFSDMGAWHGYALPDMDSTSYYGGFSGPLAMKMWGQWVSKNLCQLELTDAASMTAIDLSKAKAELNYKPGKLEQTLELEQLNIKLSLIFVSDRSALIQTHITNKSEKNQSLFVGWKGELFPKGIALSKSKKGLQIDFEDGDEFFLMHNDSDKSIQISPDKHSYQMILMDKREIASGETLEVNLLHSYYFNQEEAAQEASQYNNWLSQPDQLFSDNKSRWNGYLNKALDSDNSLLKKTENRKLVSKCVQTLMTNWRSPACSTRESSHQQHIRDSTVFGHGTHGNRPLHWFVSIPNWQRATCIPCSNTRMRWGWLPIVSISILRKIIGAIPKRH